MSITAKTVNYSDLYNELKLIFDQEKPEIDLPEGISIRNLRFLSEIPAGDFFNPEDSNIRENNCFSYPVFCPVTKSSNVILMLHGLNERSWIKYLAWAHRLSVMTSSYVILFPISFHINRSPGNWSDPRSMLYYLNLRNSLIGKNKYSSFVNVALSNRLTDDPMRFFYSGYQTLNDITKLVTSIQSGNHTEIPSGARVNIFAYSIGAFLSEIILMGNPGNLFSDSKLFIFCGGSVFSNMNGSSRLIMDKRAFESIYSYFLNDFEGLSRRKNRLSEFLRTCHTGLAFRSMIDLNRLRSFREKILLKLQDKISVVALKRDTVIPCSGITDTFKATKRKNIIKILDFKYSYTHENPFPLQPLQLKEEVNRCFDLVFNRAASFLV